MTSTLKGGNAPMDDLTATRLCAEAMGIELFTHPGDDSIGIDAAYTTSDGDVYAPLHDDAQAMALVKRFRLDCRNNSYDADWASKDFEWEVEHNTGDCLTIYRNSDLNRAILMCVAQMQAAK